MADWHHFMDFILIVDWFSKKTLHTISYAKPLGLRKPIKPYLNVFFTAGFFILLLYESSQFFGVVPIA
jgi:hypothetical protein